MVELSEVGAISELTGTPWPASVLVEAASLVPSSSRPRSPLEMLLDGDSEAVVG